MFPKKPPPAQVGPSCVSPFQWRSCRGFEHLVAATLEHLEVTTFEHLVVTTLEHLLGTTWVHLLFSTLILRRAVLVHILTPSGPFAHIVFTQRHWFVRLLQDVLVPVQLQVAEDGGRPRAPRAWRSPDGRTCRAEL